MWRREAPKSWSLTGICSGWAGSWVAATAEGRDRRLSILMSFSTAHRGHRDKPPPPENLHLSHHPQAQTHIYLPNQLWLLQPSRQLPPTSPPTFLRPQIRKAWPCHKVAYIADFESPIVVDSCRCTLLPTRPDTPQLERPVGSVPSWPADHSPPVSPGGSTHTPPGTAPHLDLAPCQTPLSPHSSVAPRARGLCSGAQASEVLQQETLRPPLGSSRVPPSLRRLPVPELGC